MVTISGYVSSITLTHGQVAFTLAEEYRPRYKLPACIAKYDSTTGGYVVNTDGKVEIFAGSGTNKRLEMYATSWHV